MVADIIRYIALCSDCSIVGVICRFVCPGSHKSSGLPHHVTVHKLGSHQHGCQGHHAGHHGNGQVPSEEALLSRYRSMDGVCRPYANDLVTAFDLGQHKTAVDLGGQCHLAT